MALERRGTRAVVRQEVPDVRPGFDRWIDRAAWLDPPADALQGWVGGFYEVFGDAGRTLKSLLHGTRPLHHPLHPAAVSVPLGAFTAMVVADWLGLLRVVPSQIGPFCLIVGIVGMVFAVAAGYTDYTGTYGRERRYATVHGLTMTAVLLAMVVSLVLRYQPSASLFFAGILLSTAAFLVMLWAAYLGGHLSFALGTMVNRNAFAQGVADWVSVGRSADFEDGKPARVTAGDTPILMVRLGGRLNAIAATCGHAGGPLDEGALEGDIVTCPWHGSRFCVRDGRVEDGPSTYDQPAFLVREEEGKVQVRLAHPLN